MKQYSEEMVSKYSDPDNINVIIEKLKASQTHFDARKIIEQTYPDWFIHTTGEYSKDYPHFKKNWKIICDRSGVTPKSIVLVDFLIFNSDKHKLVSEFSERMTKEGYCVRRKEEFISCSNCGAAIPSKLIWKKLTELKIPAPRVWSERCQRC